MGVASIQDIEAMGMDVWPEGQGPTPVNKNIQERGLERLKVIINFPRRAAVGIAMRKRQTLVRKNKNKKMDKEHE